MEGVSNRPPYNSENMVEFGWPPPDPEELKALPYELRRTAKDLHKASSELLGAVLVFELFCALTRRPEVRAKIRGTWVDGPVKTILRSIARDLAVTLSALFD